ncbi:hypothetical protein ACJX0J_038436, partial [Zea mays]
NHLQEQKLIDIFIPHGFTPNLLYCKTDITLSFLLRSRHIGCIYLGHLMTFGIDYLRLTSSIWLTLTHVAQLFNKAQ